MTGWAGFWIMLGLIGLGIRIKDAIIYYSDSKFDDDYFDKKNEDLHKEQEGE